jgi:hypothetical protein
MSSDWTRLKGVSNIGDSLLNDQLVSNVVDFFTWSLLGIGAFFNVNRPTSSGAYGGSQYKLRLAEDPNYNKGQVWEGFRANWVWESGVDYAYQPIPISGVYLNNTFLPLSTSGNYSYKINYPLGRVVFASSIPINSRVELDFSYKYINCYQADSPWFKELQFNSFIIDTNFDNYGSGVRSTMAQNRIQLPAIIVESVPRRTLKPYQQGGGQWVYQDLLFHIFAETTYERGNLVDILTYQKEKRIFFYDKNAISSANAFPLDYYGSITPSAVCYPDLIRLYPGLSAFFYEVTSQETVNLSPGLFQGIVRAQMEVQIPNI